MAKSTIKLANGTVITIEGSPEEVAHLISMYGDKKAHPVSETKGKYRTHKKVNTSNANNEKVVNVLELVNATKDADDFDQIEKNILDKASQVDRVLLPLFISERELSPASVLTSNDIYLFLKEFGINMALPNVSKTLSKTAMKYVMADSTRKRGTSTSYKISRKGKQYVEQILSK